MTKRFFAKFSSVWLLVHKELMQSGNAPKYLADNCQFIADINMRRLRSTNMTMCAVRRSHYTFGDRCFTASCSTPVELITF